MQNSDSPIYLVSPPRSTINYTPGPWSAQVHVTPPTTSTIPLSIHPIPVPQQSISLVKSQNRLQATKGKWHSPVRIAHDNISTPIICNLGVRRIPIQHITNIRTSPLSSFRPLPTTHIRPRQTRMRVIDLAIIIYLIGPRSQRARSICICGE